MKPIVFISSTSEFAAERQSLARDLERLYDPYLYEEEEAQGTSPQKRVRAMIERAHVFVGILGTRYGSQIPSDARGRSIVEWEFDTAKARHAELEILAFLKELPSASAIDDRQRHFLDRVRDFNSGVWCKFFDSAGELVRLVRAALERWAVSYWEVQQAQLAPRQKEINRLASLLKYVAIGGVLAAFVVAGVQVLWEPFSNVSVIVFCALAVVLIGFLILVLFLSRGDANQ